MRSFGWLLVLHEKVNCSSITDPKISKEKSIFIPVGPEYLAVGLTAIVSALTGGTWVANKILDRQQERLKNAHEYISSQKRRIDILEDQINRMPLEYVLKVDFLREIKEMHDNFKQINDKLDKLVEKLLSK